MARKKMDKLSQDVAKAMAAGMSYGKWKAMQDPVVIKPKEKHYCLNCGRELIPKTRNPPKYCDAYCGNAYREKKYREKAEAEKEESCGKLMALLQA